MSLTKEVHRLMKTVRRRTDGQVTVESFEPEGDTCQVLTIVIEPNAGLYKGGRFTFLIQIPESYPHGDQPSVWCNTEVYHPNIDTTESRTYDFATNVCLNILDHGTWNNSFGLEAIVHGLLFLMHNPNFDDPLSPFFEAGNEEYETENVKKYMAGEDIDGKGFVLELAEHGNDEDEIKLGKSGDTGSTDKLIEDAGRETQSAEQRQSLDREDGVGYEEDNCEAGFTLLEIDGELVLAVGNQSEESDEDKKATVQDDSKGNAENKTDTTTVLRETTTEESVEIKKATVDEVIRENSDNTKTNTDTETAAIETTTEDENATFGDQLANEVQISHDDCPNGNDWLIQSTMTAQTVAGGNVEDSKGDAKLNRRLTSSGKLCTSENRCLVEKVLKKILTHVQYIGGKILSCFNDRYL